MEQVSSNRRGPLSQRIRPNSEAAPYMVEEVRQLEAEIERRRADRRSELSYVVSALRDTRGMGLSELRDHIAEVRAWASNRLTVGASAETPAERKP